MQKEKKLSRRDFLGGATVAAAAFSIVPEHVLSGAGRTPPSQKINLVGIGTGGQGSQNIATFMKNPDVQVVAVCDVNREGPGYLSWNWEKGKGSHIAGREPVRRFIEEKYAQRKPSGTYKGCASYNDYRELLDKEDIDAVMVATPDHSHAVITMAVLKKRKHVFCEKPLTYTVHEARMVTEAARKAGVATQMGNQGQASEESRLVCEFIQDGAIGQVRKVQVDCGSGGQFWRLPTGMGRPEGTPPVPDGLDWDRWLGPAQYRPYHPDYLPFIWRNWWDFGMGHLGDLGAHKLSTVFKALKLGHPTSVEASATKFSSEVHPHGAIVRYEFPARGDMPPVKLHWFHGCLRPERPEELEPGRHMGGSTYFGDKGTLMDHRLIPETKMKAYKLPPKTLPRSVGHYKEWIEACKGGPAAGSNFVDHAGHLSEVLALGNIAIRTRRKLDWDGPNMKITNMASANKYVTREYRDGWSL